ncbi:MAG: hypothetical protein HY286_11285 [Planctomycetes bacterium]|nr:hypothetical protein [Planctomycetota bacterium]
MIRKGPASETKVANRPSDTRRIDTDASVGAAVHRNGTNHTKRAIAPPKPPENVVNPTERTCPTRISPAPVLISHRISTCECQSRQREMYHKCWDCEFSNRMGGHPARPSQSLQPAASTNGVDTKKPQPAPLPKLIK